jgi:hypothetical protein
MNNKPFKKRKLRNQVDIPIELILDALTQSEGLLTQAGAILNKSRSWMSERCKDDPIIQAHLKQVIELTLDKYEDALTTLRKNGDKTAIIFYLKTKGRHRGYIEHAPMEQVDVSKFKAMREVFEAVSQCHQSAPVAPQKQEVSIPVEPIDLDSSQEKNGGHSSSSPLRQSHFLMP